MPAYVVDASVVVQHLILDTYTPNVDVLFQQLEASTQLCVPEFCLLECVNVVWKEVRFHDLEWSEAFTLLLDLNDLSLTIKPVSNLLQRGLEIGLQYELAVYDSLYIALAEDLDCPLITVDNKQETAARAAGISIKPITDFSPKN